MWECLSNDIELFRKDQLQNVPMLVNLGDGEFAEGNYWFTIDCLPEKQSLGYLDVGDADLLEEHKEGNVVKLKTKEAIKAKPDWDVAENAIWDADWLEQPYELFGDSKWNY